MILSIALTQELKFDQENDVHFLDAWPKSVNVGNFVFVFEGFLKLKHETKVEHIFVLGNSGELFEITLNVIWTRRLEVRAEYALNLVEKGRFGGENSKQPPNHRVTHKDSASMTNRTCDN
ncbi:hypothetical protein CsSME_00005130 [Camellia sinensis var. sinensis]